MLTAKLERKELQSIFNDIYFAKTFIRNKLNHASEDEVLSDEMKTYFASFGYPVDTEYDVGSISRFLYTAIGKLKL